ncbi:MAG: LysE family transporter [Chloroflexi bacterium]|nr:LysE family transporter [Chloroflexota bacterium]
MPEAGVFFAFSASFVVGLSGAASPGPLLAFNIRETVERGFWAGPSVSLGHSLLEAVVVALLALGLGRVLQTGLAGAVVALAGGIFLLWMAWGIYRQPAGELVLTPAQGIRRAGGARRPILGGVLVSLSNPFWFVWWMTAGAALLFRSYQLGIAGLVAFYFGHILADFSWYSAVSFAVATGRRLMTPPIYRGIMLSCAAFLALMAVYFLTCGFNFLGGLGIRGWCF